MKAKDILISIFLILLAAAGIYMLLFNKPAQTQKQQQSVSCGKPVKISDSIKRYDAEIPSSAESIQNDLDWTVYKQDIEDLDCYSACRLYLENNVSHNRYFLLETKGEATHGTELPIKARNKLAYGSDEVGYKEIATYEKGYIQSVEYVIVLTPTKLLLEGSPDCHNNYSYILDLETYSAIHIEAYSGFSGMVYENGKDYLDFYSPDYSAGYRQEYVERYDLDGNLISREPYEEKDE